MPGLTDHQQRRLDLADMLRAVLHVAHYYGDEGRQRDIRELLARLAAGRFRLAVAGQFSRGKTTLMNALLGDTFLPTGALPVTSVVTTVRYGTRARALIRSRAGGLPVEVPVAEAARYIERSSAERSRMRVASVEIEVPAELLRLGFEFIDTPGVGSAIAANTAATMHLLPQADAIVVVTSFDSALTQAETEFISASSARAGHIFLVINKRDLVSESDVAAVTDYVRGWARNNLPGLGHHVFGLSALAALEAATSGDDEQLADSGFEQFRGALTWFLATRQGSTALRAVAHAAADLVRRQAAELRAGLRTDQDEAGNAGVIEAFDKQIGALRANIDAAAVQIAERLSAALPQLLTERRVAWNAELRSLLADTASPARQAANREVSRQPEPAGWPPAAVRQAAAEWLEQTSADMQDRIVGLIGDQISSLHDAARSPRELGGAVAGEAGCPSHRAGWLAGQVPDLLIPAVEWGSPEPPPDHQRRRSRWTVTARGRPREGDLETAIERFAAHAQAGFENAAMRWAAQLGEQAAREVTAEARQFRRYLGTRPRVEDLTILTDLDRRLADFLESLDREHAASAAAPAPAPAPRPESRPPARSADQPRCQICALLEDELTDFLIRSPFQLATSEAEQARHARAGGYCSLHTWRFANMSSPVGISAGYAALTRRVADQMDSALQAGTTACELANQLDSLVAAASCPACAALASREAQAARQLATAPDAALVPALCLHHLARVLHASPPRHAAAAMISTVSAALRRAADDMRSYALKREALRHSLVTDDEAVAHSNALRLLAGAPALAQPWEPA